MSSRIIQFAFQPLCQVACIISFTVLMVSTGCIEPEKKQNQTEQASIQKQESFEQRLDNSANEAAKKLGESQNILVQGESGLADQEQVSKQSKENVIGSALIAHSYSYHNDNLWASLSFESKDKNNTSGTLTLSGSILTVVLYIENDRNYVGTATDPDRTCKFVYSYEIKGNYIKATFVKSDIGYDGNSHTWTYNEKDNTISMYSGIGEMIFK